MISGESGGGNATPAVPYQPQSRASGSRSAVTGQRLPLRGADARRTQERVLRIVFQPYIDVRGRLHEASAVHAVVQSGEWQQEAIAFSAPLPDRNAGVDAAGEESLAEIIDRADPMMGGTAATDPNLPEPAAVAAARARRADPIKAIQDDVAARLAPKTGRTPGVPASSPERAAHAPAVDNSASTPVKSGASSTATGSATSGSVAAPKTASGSEAQDRIKSSPEFQARAAEVESSARQAGQVGALPPSASAVKTTVQAPGFPASVPEEN